MVNGATSTPMARKMRRTALPDFMCASYEGCQVKGSEWGYTVHPPIRALGTLSWTSGAADSPR
jgi:hypothetical protein